METKLFIYDELLTAVRGSMSSVQKDYSRISVWDKNLNTLLSYVEDIVVCLSVLFYCQYFLVVAVIE